MNKERVRSEIIQRYGTYKAFADKYDIRPTLLSHWLKNPTQRFKALLDQDGINYTDKEKEEMIKTESEIENPEFIIKELKETLYAKNSLIKELQNLVISKDKLIDQKDKLIEQLDRFANLHENIK